MRGQCQSGQRVCQEAIDEHFKLIMIRPNMVSLASQMVSDAGQI
jgi:deoxyribose-phosphate aldolase